MIGIVIVAHGGLGREMLSAVEHVLGPQEGMTTVAIEADSDVSLKSAEVCDAADRVDTGDGVVVATDMLGSSPANASMRSCDTGDRRLMYGANLPMLIKLVQSREKPVSEAVNLARLAGLKYLGVWAEDPPALEVVAGR